MVSSSVKMTIKRFMSERRFDKGVVITAFAVLAALPMATDDTYILRLAGTICLYITLTLGLNVVTGFAGMLDLGYVAFFGLGAYAYALLNSYQLGLHLPFVLSLPAAGLIGALSALCLGLPMLRLKGDYLAVVTLAYGQMFRLLVVNLDRPVNLTNGPNGIYGVDAPIGLGIDMLGLAPRLYVVLLLTGMVYIATARLATSKYGRGWMAIRDDANAAACMGIEVPRYRLLAFVYGGTIAALAGACFAMFQGSVFPNNFGMHELITVLCMVALGGSGSVSGAVLGASALVVVPELLRGYSIYRMAIFGVLLILGMRYRPQGWLPRRLPTPPKRLEEADSFTVPKIAGGHLRVQDLSVSFGGIHALESVSFDVAPGEVLGVIGPNGAGKSTLINVISGFYKSSNGSVTLDGHLISGLPPHKVAAAGVARTFQNIRLFHDLTVEENILVGHHRRLKTGLLATLLALPRWRKRELEARDHAREVLAFLGHGIVGKRFGGVLGLTYGDRRRVELARALVSNPRILLLDEPAAGMTNLEIRELTDHILLLNKAGYTILLIEHHMNVISAVSHRVLALDHGQELAFGTPEAVLADKEVVKAYLGEDHSTAPTQTKQTEPQGKQILRLSGLRVSYGAENVLKGLDLEVRAGSLTCMIGSNAAGKTTTLRAITCDIKPCGGAVWFKDRQIDGLETADIIKLGIGVVPEGRRIFGKMTVEENLELGAYLNLSQLTTGFDYVYSLFPILKERRGQRAGTLSGGEQQMLAIGRAMMTSPSLILLDEPSMGLAPVMVERVMDALRSICANGTSVLMVEQNAAVATQMADRLYVLANGTATLADAESDLVKAYHLG